jgi:hypothetical protein
VQIPPDYLVLDPFCGTGSIGEASLRCGRAYLGADIDDAVVALATTRLERVAAGLNAGEFPDEAKLSQIRELYVTGTTVHHSVEVRARCFGERALRDPPRRRSVPPRHRVRGLRPTSLAKRNFRATWSAREAISSARRRRASSRLACKIRASSCTGNVPPRRMPWCARMHVHARAYMHPRASADGARACASRRGRTAPRARPQQPKRRQPPLRLLTQPPWLFKVATKTTETTLHARRHAARECTRALVFVAGLRGARAPVWDVWVGPEGPGTFA